MIERILSQAGPGLQSPSGDRNQVSWKSRKVPWMKLVLVGNLAWGNPQRLQIDPNTGGPVYERGKAGRVVASYSQNLIHLETHGPLPQHTHQQVQPQGIP